VVVVEQTKTKVVVRFSVTTSCPFFRDVYLVPLALYSNFVSLTVQTDEVGFGESRSCANDKGQSKMIRLQRVVFQPANVFCVSGIFDRRMVR
jgi:hypothetical protein